MKYVLALLILAFIGYGLYLSFKGVKNSPDLTPIGPPDVPKEGGVKSPPAEEHQS
jgi:hypothetical protein